MPASPLQHVEPIGFSDIAGWPEDDHGAALAAFRHSCAEIVADGRAFARPVVFGGERRQWLPVCEIAAKAIDGRAFFEQNFVPLRVSEVERPEGLFTGYYEPEAEGSLTPSPDYPAAIYRKPPDLVSFGADAAVEGSLAYGRIVDGAPRPTRAEAGGLAVDLEQREGVEVEVARAQGAGVAAQHRRLGADDPARRDARRPARRLAPARGGGARRVTRPGAMGTHRETPRQLTHVLAGGFALLLRWTTWWQAALLALVVYTAAVEYCVRTGALPDTSFAWRSRNRKWWKLRKASLPSPIASV